jgi:uncharacterized phage protein gp47/JayE
MPKKGENQNPQNPVFSKEEWLARVREKIGREPWGTALLKTTDALMVEVVRVGESDNVMVRIRGGNVKNAIKLTRKEHIDSLLEIVDAVASNYNNLRDKLEAIREILPSGRRVTEEEEV